MSDDRHVYRCTACSQVAILRQKLEGTALHGKSPGTEKRCGGLMVYEGPTTRRDRQTEWMEGK